MNIEIGSLLAEKNKYLSQMLLQGLKGNFNSILKWLQFLDLNSSHLISLIKSDEESINIVLDTLRPGLLSKSNDVALWTYRLLLKLIEELFELNLQPVIWNWFCKDSGGLSTCLLSLKKHTNVNDYIGTLFVMLGKDNISELLTMELKKNISDNLEYINLIHGFLDVFTNTKTISAQVN